MKRIIILFTFFILILIFSKNSYSIENRILLKINNEIITSIDVFNETKYLLAINNKLKTIDNEDLYKISIKSLLREKIKKIEILKNLNSKEIYIDEEYLDKLTLSTSKKLGFQSINDFNKYLDSNKLNIEIIKEKISVESLWNELIYKKFSKKLIIDKDELKKKIIKDNNKIIKSYLLSEIVFKILSNENFNMKLNLIEKDIKDKGFSNAALLHSISGTQNSGGDLGWITEISLNQKIKNKVMQLKIGDYTKPIIIPGGFLILKAIDIKETKNKYDINKKLEELIRFTTNQQLNQLSNIYFEKVKKEITINEL